MHDPTPSRDGTSKTSAPKPHYSVKSRAINTPTSQEAWDDVYAGLFNAIEEGFCVFELLLDDEDRPFDYRFLEANPAFEEQTGLVDAVGHTARELVPGLEQHWVDIYGQVALTGQPIRFVQGSEAMGRWFDVEAFRFGGEDSRKVALLFTDITKRKQAEDAVLELNRTLEARVEERTRQVRDLVSRLTLAEQAERARISQMLHDELQQYLFGLQLQCANIRTLTQTMASEKVDAALSKSAQWLERALYLTRALTTDLTPPTLNSEDFVYSVEWLAQRLNELHGIEVTVEGEVPKHTFSYAHRVVLYQVLREVLFNVIKHAGTKTAAVALEAGDVDVCITVTDEGRGFDVAAAEAQHAAEEGFGLFHLRDRLRLFGGTMRIRSAPGEGCAVRICMPM